MIRINLLPIKQLKKLIQARSEVLGLVVLVAVILLGIAMVALAQSAKVSNLQTTNSELTKKRQSYQSILNEIAKLQKDKENLVTKLEMIGKLKKGSQVTVRVLDDLANLTPTNRLWLNSLDQKPGSLLISGIALDNSTIAQFMKSLDESPYFTSPKLSRSSLTEVGGRKLKQFSLTCGITGIEG